jgi:hypothetical protein
LDFKFKNMNKKIKYEIIHVIYADIRFIMLFNPTKYIEHPDQLMCYNKIKDESFTTTQTIKKNKYLSRMKMIRSFSNK